MVEVDADGTPNGATIIPIIDGGTEGLCFFAFLFIYFYLLFSSYNAVANTQDSRARLV